MKQLIFFILIFLCAFTTGSINAARNTSADSQAQTGMETAPSSADLATTTDMVQNQNRIQTQNQGQGQQLQSQQQQNVDSANGFQAKNDNNNMSQVAREVQQLQQIRTTGGIGEQVREIARQ